MSVGKKSKDFQLTLNQVEKWPALLTYLKSLKSVEYLIAAEEEAPSTGHKHIHCFVQFSYSMKLSLKKTQGAHIEICQGTPQQNKDYVKKNGNVIEEFGKLKNWGGHTIKAIKEMTKEDRMELPFVYYEKVKSLTCDESNLLDANDYFKEIEVYYFYGESGKGKTQMAVEKIKELAKDGKIKTTKFNEVKYVNGFWIGVDSTSMQEVALYDDFRDGHMFPSEFINFIDYNTHNMNIKNGHVKNMFKYILITSVQSPDELYAKFSENNTEPKKQWLRRLNHIIYVE